MDPHTGEILAMANEPTFNPNVYTEAGPDQRRNRAVQDIYEPGSTFKIVTASAALETGALSADDMIDTGAGAITLGSRRVTEYEGHRYGVLSLTDVIVKSSNVGAIKVGFKLGAERLGRYVRAFGFGTRLSPDFPGESAGIVWAPERWTESALASVSMGYQVGVTPLQMAVTASTVANGGELMQPRVVRAVIEGNRRSPVRRRVLRRVISTQTAASLTAIMEAVVDRGTAKASRIEGYTSPARPARPRSWSTAATPGPTTTPRSSGSCRRGRPRSRSSSSSTRRTRVEGTPAASSRRRSSGASPRPRCATWGCRRASTRSRPCWSAAARSLSR